MEILSTTHSIGCDKENQKDKERCFTFFVDDKQFQVETKIVTGIQILNLASIPREVGLLFIAEDGSQSIVQPEETITLEKCKHFKKAPRFRRGAK